MQVVREFFWDAVKSNKTTHICTTLFQADINDSNTSIIYMEKEKKGLADAEEGEFILNESGTSVSTDQVEGLDVPAANDLKSADKHDDGQKKADSKQQNGK